MLPLRQAGWKVLFFPGAECVHVGGASHGGRMFRENVRGHLRFLAKHRGVREAERARRLLLLVAAAARRRLFRGERGRMYRDAAAGSRRDACRSCSSDDRWLRLALATGDSAVAGSAWSPARSGCAGASVTLAWSLALLFGALAVTFAVGASLTLALVLLLGAGCRGAPVRAARAAAGADSRALVGARRRRRARRAALARRRRDRRRRALPPRARAQAGRVRLPLARGRRRVRRRRPASRLRVPALARLSGARRTRRRASIRPRSSCTRPRVLAPLALLVAYEAGYALFRRVGPAVAVVCAQVGVTALAPGHGGAYTALALPATASRQLLVPAALALAFAYVERPNRQRARVGRRRRARAGGRPPDLRDLPLAPVRRLPRRPLARRRGRSSGGSPSRSLRSCLPAAAFFAWLLPVVRDTASHAPGKDELHRAFVQYAGQLDVFSDTSYRLAPEVFGRAARSRSPRSSSCRSPGSRCGGAGRRTCSAASSRSPR